MAPPNSPADGLVKRPMSSNAKTGCQLRIGSRRIEKPVVARIKNSSIASAVGSRRYRAWQRSSSKHDSSLNLHCVSILQVGFESPLEQSVGNSFRLFRKSAEKMYVLYLAFLANDDPHGNWIAPLLGESWLYLGQNVFVARIVLHTH